eukprot:scaffold727_cov173-Ochromonas_danica.AAC.9
MGLRLVDHRHHLLFFELGTEHEQSQVSQVKETDSQAVPHHLEMRSKGEAGAEEEEKPPQDLANHSFFK